MKYTEEQKKAFLNMSLDDKVKRTKQLILEWYLQFEGKVYVSFSGGKDSTVLLHIARSIKGCEDILAVYDDTGLEFPEIREFAKSIDNVLFVKPKKNFKQVIEKYGYPIISKEVSQKIYEARHTKSDKLRNKRLSKTVSGIPNMWRPLLDADFEISNSCCRVMKKSPLKTFEHKTGMKPIVGIMSDESSLRMQSYMQGDCNQFSAARPVSRPLMFWTEQDVLKYIYENNITISPVYGDVIVHEDGTYSTTGYKRTGCMFCMYGLHLDDLPGRFVRMYETHPTIFKYIMKKLNGINVIKQYFKCLPQTKIDKYKELLTLIEEFNEC